MPAPKKKIFVSYAHEDESHRIALTKALRPLEREGLEVWHDRRLVGGDEWRGEIDEHLESADLILLLVSVDFLASDYVRDVELRRALERHDSGEARVVPIIVRACAGRSRVKRREGLLALTLRGTSGLVPLIHCR